MECLFCNIVKGSQQSFRVWENTDFIVFLDVNPINRGHLLLITKQHFEDVFSISEVLYSKMFIVAKEVSNILRKAVKSKRVGLAIEGFGVPHVHIHLVPVNNGNELNPLRAKPASAEDLGDMQKILIKQLAEII